ncbi:MAG: bactofilin family protein [Elstera sp.]
MFSKSNSRRDNQTSQKSEVGIPSILSIDMVVTGNLASSGEVHLDGAVKGDVDARILTIGETAEVRGNVSADTVRVSGTVIGAIRAREVILTRTARIEGDIHHDILSMEAGARLEGMCRRLAAVMEKSDDEPNTLMLTTRDSEAAE